ncbi:hypothetical protein CJP74_02880 [Psittacicella melopsittaci]|uniref:Uncharacterized protein n=1 Tax=Psittacicella melopsittaci TaxID=2028576 RepID=A0A3A1YAD4_9GAMM|nr:YihY family inner membrane protein [Psittacicella melopsittaci]RIY33087.1 hypothetical protein CJP74_02880 [Psittacicella melopsittaci]
MKKSSLFRKAFMFFRRTKGFKGITKGIFHLYLIFITVLGNGVSVVAGALTYNTLLAIVPIVLVFFSVLHMLPAFTDMRESLQNFIFANISPSNVEDFNSVFDNIIAKTANLGLPSVASLFVIAFLLIRTIDKTINKNIWQIKDKRSMLQSFTSYWTVISFGPILLGGIVFIKSYLIGIYSLDNDLISSSILIFLNYIQSFMLWFILFFTYTVFPNTKVNWIKGAIASFLAVLGLNLAKLVFVYYVTNIASYYVIYGAIAAFPITVFWLYIVWYIVLMGAALTKVLNQNNFYTLYRSYLLEESNR